MRDQAAKGVVWAAVRTWGVQLGTLLVFVPLARILGPRDFGVVALATVYLDISDRLIDQGFASAIVQRKDLEDSHLDSAFWMSMAIALFGVVVTLVAAPFIADWVNQPLLAPVLRVLSLTLVFTAMVSVQDAILRRRMAFRSLAMRGLSSVSVGGLVGLAMAFSGFGVWSLVGQQLAWELTAIVVLWRATHWRPHFRASFAHLKQLWHIGAPITGSRLLDTGQRRISDFIIGGELGAAALGYFAVGKRMAQSLSTMLVDSIVQVSFPAFARVQHDPERLRNGYYRTVQYTAMVAAPAFLGLAALAPEIIRVWFGHKWLPSIPVSQAIAILALTWLTSSLNANVLMAIGAVRVQFWLGMAGSLSNLAAIVIALPWGINGVAYAMLIRAFLFAPIIALVMRHYVKLDYGIVTRRLVPPVAGALAAVLAVYATRAVIGSAHPSWVMAVAIPLGAAAHALVIRLLAPGLMTEVWALVRQSRAARQARQARRGSGEAAHA